MLLSWNYRIRPLTPLPDLPGNLLFEICRRKGDTLKIDAPKYPKHHSKGIKTWAYPQTSGLSGRHLVICVNKVRYLDPVTDEMRRYVLARNLAPPSKPNDIFNE